VIAGYNRKGEQEQPIPVKTEGNIVGYVRDKEHMRQLLVITREESKCNLYSFYQRRAIKLIVDQFDIDENTLILPFFSPPETTQYILLNVDEGQIGVLDFEFT
jgi:hypothetical protein